MFAYYLNLALHSLRRNVVLTSLMIAAIGVGIGASMTTLTVFRAQARDPIPGKSRQLFAPQIDNWGKKIGVGTGDKENLQQQLSYTDATALMQAHTGRRQSAMYAIGGALTPADAKLRPYQVHARAVYTDFFPMFEVPFQYGGGWSARDDEEHANVMVISRELNEREFAGRNSVGQTLNFEAQRYRIVGVLDAWQPVPKFYDLNNNKYGKSEQLYIPLTKAIDAQMFTWGNFNCNGNVGDGWAGRLHSECVFLQFWVELPTPDEAARYRRFLDNYANEQQRSGRFHWPAHTKLRDVREWLVYQQAVQSEVKVLVLVSFSFLAVCLLNAMGLMLAKIMGRIGDISVRRALGANRRAVFSQCLIEAGVVGLAGGLLGLALTGAGLLGVRSMLSESLGSLTRMRLSDVVFATLLGIVATMIAGLYPTWRATQIQPAWQLKVQ